MNIEPSLAELRELHRRCTYPVVQALLKGHAAPAGWWLYLEDGKPNTDMLRTEDLHLFFSNREDSAMGVVKALAHLARSYLVTGGEVRAALARAGRQLPRAVILVAPPHKLVEGEVVKTFVLTEHQVFLADSPVKERGKSVLLADLVLMPASLTHNESPSTLN
ncbi:hypothetical protein [Acidovorax sp. sic0104]|uniref:hypothetical protein n=1 Tax=Acidovorax sp. sic0104 TaxID=2854784 RepID=UPI001C4568AC|nr:hypothetical protein [Acidovorax sp. sic0104]MBV7542197.1 hypothetical protein [Acidovorax sp. sic0104]